MEELVFLHIPAREEYNNTSVVCELTIRDPFWSIVLSAPAVLRVQGMLIMMSQMFNDSVAPRHENMMAITDAISQNSYIIITMFHKSIAI